MFKSFTAIPICSILFIGSIKFNNVDIKDSNLLKDTKRHQPPYLCEVIYLDYNATTPCHPTVVEAMLPYFSEKFGNASSSTYSLGWQSQAAVDLAREKVASLVGVESDEIVFTSGATEAINLGIKGLFDLFSAARPGVQLHLITCVTEHSAVLSTHQYLERYRNARVTYLPVNEMGLIDMQELTESITEHTVLISIMFANNETGVIQNLKAISELAKDRNIFLFSDTTQVVGKMPVNLKELGIGMACLSAHKMYGPKGVGALYVSKRYPRVKLMPIIHGGNQENGLRSGTLNVPGIVGLGKAAELSINFIDIYKELIAKRHKFEVELLSHFDCKINGHGVERLPNATNVSFRNINLQHLIKHWSTDLCISLGSACNSNPPKNSHVLESMKLDDHYIKGSMRLSMGIYTTEEELISTINFLKQKIKN